MVDRLRAFFAGRTEPGIHAVYLFGSHARGAAHADSDVDIAVLLDRDVYPTAAARFDFRLRIIGALDIFLGGHGLADVLILNDAPALLGRSIVYDGVPVSISDEDAALSFGRDVQLRAADLAPFITKHRRRVLEALSR